VNVGYGDVALYEVVMEHLNQSIEASVDPKHRHRLRNELRAAEGHVNDLVGALRKSPDAREPRVQLDEALSEAGGPQPGKVSEWLHTMTELLHSGSSS